VGALGVRPIEYRPWRGERTNPERRFLVISWNLFRRSLRAKGVIVVLVFGILLAHTFPIIGAILFPHEELTNADMIGSEEESFSPPSVNYTVNVTEGLVVDQNLTVNGTFVVAGNISLTGTVELHGSISGMGGLFADIQGNEQMLGFVFVDGNKSLVGGLMVQGLLSGNGTISGTGDLTGNGTVVGIITGGDGQQDGVAVDMGGYLTSGLFVLFAILLAAIICSDVISDDLADSSFVLYFSRPVRTLDYLLGKFVGLLMVMSIFCLVLPLLYVLVMMGTQSGNDYGGGLVILGKTFLVGLLTSVFFLPFGLLMSSLTKRKAYAGIGIFASFFVLMIIGGMFSQFDDQWALVDPGNMLFYTYYGTFGAALPHGIASWELASVMLAITVVPMTIVYWLLQRKGGGK